MKYMGSKRVMLRNGLGDLLTEQARKRERVVDLFSGGASVAWFAAEQFNMPVLAVDLQEYAAVLARAIIARTWPLSHQRIGVAWISRARKYRETVTHWRQAVALEGLTGNIGSWRKRAIDLCITHPLKQSPMWNAYGGHYFSPTQALTFDALTATLPAREPQQSVCRAAIVIAASQCVASPGHTAQPFKATRTAGAFLREAWLRDPLRYIESAISMLLPRHARVRGKALVGDAVKIASRLYKTDLVFVDPPYSGVHYSRFYHVLETIARGGYGSVSGVGRYPPPEERPISRFSRKSESIAAMTLLIERLAAASCTVIVTFPSGVCSNGLSGHFVEKTAARWFRVDKTYVRTRFSTLGGNNEHRKARQQSRELILLLRPRSHGR